MEKKFQHNYKCRFQELFQEYKFRYSDREHCHKEGDIGRILPRNYLQKQH
jgi:hypothetical protein